MTVVVITENGKPVEIYIDGHWHDFEIWERKAPVNYHRLKTVACDDDSIVRVDYTKLR